MQNILKKTWVPYLFLGLIIFIVYFPTLFYGITYADDQFLVVGNYEFNKDPSNTKQAFFEDIYRTPEQQGYYYRPLLRLSFILDAQCDKNSLIFMSHLSNILLHVLAICLFFYLLLLFDIHRNKSFLLSLIFAVHPLAVHTVAWIPGRNDSLLAIFTLATFILFIKYLKTKNIGYCLGSIFFLFLGLLTKETAIIIPLMLCIYVLIFENFKEVLKRYRLYLWLIFGWATVLILYFWLRQNALSNIIGSSNYNVFGSIYKNLGSLIPAVGKIFLPFDLSVFPILKDMSMLYGLISISLLAVFSLFSKKEYRFIVFGMFWFLFFVALTLIKSVNAIPEFSENRLYLPMLGFVFILHGIGKVNYLDEYLKTRFGALAFIKKLGLLLLLIGLIVLTFRHIKNYKNNVTFWTNAVETSPSHSFNHSNLGITYYLNGQLGLAQQELTKALNINSKERFVHNFLGLTYLNEDKLDEAVVEFNREITLTPLYPGTYLNLGMLYYKKGDLENAKTYWQKAFSINPAYIDGNFYYLVDIYYNQSDKKLSREYINQMREEGVGINLKVF